MKSISRRNFLRKTGFGLAGITMANPFALALTRSKTSAGKNSWMKVSLDISGARRSCSIRYADNQGIFLLWGFHGYLTEYYGNPEKPWDGNKEYDVVAFDPDRGSWKSHLPYVKQDEWAGDPPPMHMCSYYQGITIGSHRPQLKEREGVLRPDLNVIFDQVTYDSKRNRMVYFTGGRTFSYNLDIRKWSDICRGKSAPPVLGGSLCYDPVGDQIVFAGGDHVAERGPDGHSTGSAGTWIFDCKQGSWSPANCGTEPAGRIASRLVYDRKNRVMVFFGGDHHTHYLADTWIYDPARHQWKRSETSQGPVARAGHFTVYDPGTGWVIIGGGYNREDLTDMWAYDVGSDKWHGLKGKVPTGFYIAGDIAPQDRLIVLITATKREGDTKGCNEIYPVRTTWTYHIDENSLVNKRMKLEKQNNILKRPVEKAISGTRPDPARRRIQMERIAAMPINQWVKFNKPGRTAPFRNWGSCSFDVNRGRIVFWGGGHCGYGGNDYDFYDVEEHTWISSPLVTPYPERNWDKSGGVYPAGLMFDGSPFMRHGRKAYAWDPVSDLAINMKYVYLTAGYEPELLADCPPVNPDIGSGEDFNRSGYAKWVTWTYNDRTEKWNILCPALPGLDLLVSTPRGVMGVNYFWRAVNSSERYDHVIYKSEKVVDNSVYLLDVANKRWQKLTRSGPWPQNLYEMTALVYDNYREQLILHGGGPERDELWCFPLETGRWEKLNPRFAPGTNGQPPVCQREAVYLPDDDVFLTAGSPADKNAEPAFWAYHVGENRWYRLNINPPGELTMNDMVGANRAWIYDPIHDIVFMLMREYSDSVYQTLMYGMRFHLDQ